MQGTTFENELKRIFDNINCLNDKKYIGRAFYGKIDNELRLKAQYVTLGYADHYEALKLEVLKRNDGVIDSNIIRFNEFFGKKQVSNPNFQNGVFPHIWKYNNKIEWYAYHPTLSDIKKLALEVEEFVSVYQDMDMTPEICIPGGMQGM